jgi:hypothetical protein
LNLAQKFSMKKLENEKGLQMTRELWSDFELSYDKFNNPPVTDSRNKVYLVLISPLTSNIMKTTVNQIWKHNPWVLK